MGSQGPTQPRLGTGSVGCSLPQMDVSPQPSRTTQSPGRVQGAGPAGDEGWGARCWDLAQSTYFQKEKPRPWQAVPLIGSTRDPSCLPWFVPFCRDPGPGCMIPESLGTSRAQCDPQPVTLPLGGCLHKFPTQGLHTLGPGAEEQKGDLVGMGTT